ncbi:MAG: RDD family protein [Pyrinomonadaceae bacterium]
MNMAIKQNVHHRLPDHEVVLEFSPEQVRAPFIHRCIALLIDYIILAAVPVVGLFLGKVLWASGGGSTSFGSTGWLVTTLLAITNFLIFPMINGQTIGKMLTGLRIVSSDGRAASMRSLALRHLVGYTATILTAGLGFLVSAIRRDGRSLADLIAGTMVVYARKRILR